ncbi:MAG: ACT domain-containing protein [Clostridia bacterium]|nr:ACT domain-containing protein [Clostridia bacterium]
MENNTYLLVNKKILPEVFEKVIEAKALLSSKKAKSVNEACQMISLSRSVFYKYRDYVFLFDEKSHGRIITISFVLTDSQGVLSSILKYFADISANILTINQTIPINNSANVTLSVRIPDSLLDLSKIQKNLIDLPGVMDAQILASE